LIIGDPLIPTQPTRIPIRILKELTSHLNSLGIELLNREFVNGIVSLCRENITAVYSDLVNEASSDAALQILTDVAFIEITLAGQEKGEFNKLREELIKKVAFFRLILKSSVMREPWRH
jgi:hypothetical protein